MNDSLAQQTLQQFLQELSSASPTPGGGSVAALSGAMAAALVSMVGRLTLGKKKYAAVQAEMAELVAQADALRQTLTDLLQADVEAFGRVSAAYKMPKETTDEQALRAAAIQESLRQATETPWQVAQACAETLDLCRPAADKGNRSAVSDAGVAALMAEAGLRSAALNILINLKSIEDRAFCADMQARLDSLLKNRPALKDEIYNLVIEKL